MKGMLTGPVTILAWSFVRDDQPLAETANQVALALRDEIADLEAAGIGIIQVDEPALRELLPLKKRDQADVPHVVCRLVQAGDRRRRGHDADPHAPLLLGVRCRPRRDRQARRRRHIDRVGSLAWRGRSGAQAQWIRPRHRTGCLRHPLAARPERRRGPGAARGRRRQHPAASDLGQPRLRAEDPRLRRDRRLAREHALRHPRGARTGRRHILTIQSIDRQAHQ